MAIDFIDRATCPICESASSDRLCELSYADPVLKQFLTRFYNGRAKLSLLAEKHFQIDKCQQCGFIYQVGVLNDEGQAMLYGEWVDQKNSLRKKQRAKTKLFRQYAGQLDTLSKMLKQPPHRLKILEFGMGWGYWSRMATAFGYQVSGLELSPERVQHARSMGVHAIESLPKATPQYDFIYANQVFEHLPKPMAVLGELTTRLNLGGIIYLRVPDGRLIERQLKRQGWSSELNAIHPLEHINCFSRDTLILLAQKNGLKLISPPIRLDFARFWGGLKREVNDRWLATHLYFERV